MIRDFAWAWLPWIYNRVNDIFFKTQSIYRVIYNEVMIKKEWIFLKNNVIPVSSENFECIIGDYINWRCTVNPPRFIQPIQSIELENENEKKKEKHLSYLAFTVFTPDDIINLSNWINEVKWQGAYEPTIKEIFILWCCEKGKSYFHCLNEVEVEVITEMGDSMRVTL